MNLNDYLIEFIVQAGIIVGLFGLWLVVKSNKKPSDKNEEAKSTDDGDLAREKILSATLTFKQDYELFVSELISSIKDFLFNPEEFTNTDIMSWVRYDSTYLQMVRGVDKNLVVVFVDRLEFIKQASRYYRASLTGVSFSDDLGIAHHETYGSDALDPFGIYKKALSEAGLVESQMPSRAEQQFYRDIISSDETPTFIYLAGAEPAEVFVEPLPTKFSELLATSQTPPVDYSTYLINYLIEPSLEILRGNIKEAFLIHLERKNKVLEIDDIKMEFSLSEVTMRFPLRQYENKLIFKYTNSLQNFALQATDHFEEFFADFLGQFEPEEGVVFMRGATVVGWIDHRDSITSSLETSEISYTFHLVNPIA